jgi:hypothetical protein
MSSSRSGRAFIHILGKNSMQPLNGTGSTDVRDSLIRRLSAGLPGLLVALSLVACAAKPTADSTGAPALSPASGPDYFPGGDRWYSWGPAQSKENFANVEQAQWATGMYTKQRSWGPISVSRSKVTPNLNLLPAYYPMHMRWKLKDGREFILENIDIRAIMREYFKTHDLKQQWQRENRPRAKVGDGGAVLGHEIKDDTVIIKWYIEINRTPVDQRLTATGAATKWDIVKEEHFVTSIPGKPTFGIDFDNWSEVRK